MSSSRLNIKIVDSINEIEKNQAVLSHFDKRKPHLALFPPSLRPFWIQAFAKSYGADRNLAFTIVYEGDVPRLALPFQIKRDGCLEFLCDETADYNDLIYHEIDLELVKYAFEYWSKNGIHEIRLDRLPPESKTVDILKTLSSQLGWSVDISDGDKMVVVVAQPDKEIQDWNDVKRRQIKRYIRKQNALDKIAMVSFSFIETESELIELFPLIKSLHVSRWDKNGVLSKYNDSRRLSFITHVCKEALKDGSLFFPIMKIGDDLAAFIIGFRSIDTIYDWNTAFSVDHFKWSPGALLLLHVLSNSKTYGFSRYNFMRGLEEYKLIWTNRIEKNLNVTMTIP